MTMERTAKRIAARVPESVGLEPIFISILLNILLPKLLTCFADNDDLDAASVKSRVEQLHERNPDRLRRRLARSVRRQSVDVKLTEEQAEAIAAETINEILEMPAEDVYASCHESFTASGWYDFDIE